MHSLMYELFVEIQRKCTTLSGYHNGWGNLPNRHPALRHWFCYLCQVWKSYW